MVKCINTHLLQHHYIHGSGQRHPGINCILICRSILGSLYLITVDAHSKWLDVQVMSSITTAKTIEKLRMLFVNHGLSNKIVTDIGPSFTSEEFKVFMEKNEINHITSAPYHPSSNGLAERAV